MKNKLSGNKGGRKARVKSKKELEESYPMSGKIKGEQDSL